MSFIPAPENVLAELDDLLQAVTSWVSANRTDVSDEELAKYDRALQQANYLYDVSVARAALHREMTYLELTLGLLETVPRSGL